jgi:hypothetical protein
VVVPAYRQGLPQYNPSSPATKKKDGQTELHKIKKLLHNKRNGPTLFLTKVPKLYNGEKTDFSTNFGGKSIYLSAKN